MRLWGEMQDDTDDEHDDSYRRDEVGDDDEDDAAKEVHAKKEISDADADDESR